MAGLAIYGVGIVENAGVRYASSPGGCLTLSVRFRFGSSPL